MNKVTFAMPVASLSGKRSKKDPVYFRTVNGVSRMVYLANPHTKDKMNEAEHRHMTKTALTSREASRINRDETLAAAYSDWKKKGFRDRYHYIMSCLMKA